MERVNLSQKCISWALNLLLISVKIGFIVLIHQSQIDTWQNSPLFSYVYWNTFRCFIKRIKWCFCLIAHGSYIVILDHKYKRQVRVAYLTLKLEIIDNSVVHHLCAVLKSYRKKDDNFYKLFHVIENNVDNRYYLMSLVKILCTCAIWVTGKYINFRPAYYSKAGREGRLHSQHTKDHNWKWWSPPP